MKIEKIKQKHKTDTRKWGQVTLEFTFCLVVVVLLMYGATKALRWVALDLSERRSAHDTLLSTPICGSIRCDESWKYINFTNWDDGSNNSPLNQLDEGFYKSKRMGLVFNQW